MSMRRSWLVAVLLFAASSLGSSMALAQAPAAASEQPPVSPPQLAGTFVFVGGEKEVAAKNAAIEKATEDMFFAIKGMARSKLRDKTPVASSIVIAFANGNVTVNEAGTPVATSPQNGSVVAHKNSEGAPTKLSQKLGVDGKLVQHVAGENGSRTATFVLGADGKTLTLAVSIESSKLPKPVRYTLTYRR